MGCLNSGVVGLNYPLVALVDFRGYRLFAMSLIPISSDTLILGSADAGNTIVNKEPEAKKLVEAIGKSLNLRKHKISQRISTRSCLDLEIHRGLDGQVYGLDFARMFPPEYMDQSSPKGAFLSRLLRPEFVRCYKNPLCNDSYSKFLRVDPNYRQYHTEIAEATHYLRTTVIPATAAFFDSLSPESLDYNPLSLFLHRYGVNMRLLGLFYDSLREPYKRRLVLVEMLARAIKHGLRTEWREVMQGSMIPDETVLQNILLFTFNNLFTNLAIRNPKTWKDVQEAAQTRFGFIYKESIAEEFRRTQPTEGHLCLLFKRLSTMLGIRWTTHTYDYFTQNWDSYRTERTLDADDLIALVPTIHHISVVSYSLGYRKKQKARSASSDEADYWFTSAVRDFNDALGAFCEDEKQVLLQKASTLAEMGRTAAALFEYSQLLARAQSEDVSILVRVAQFLEHEEQTDLAEQYYVRALIANPNNYEALRLYADFCQRLTTDQPLADALAKHAESLSRRNHGDMEEGSLPRTRSSRRYEKAREHHLLGRGVLLGDTLCDECHKPITARIYSCQNCPRHCHRVSLSSLNFPGLQGRVCRPRLHAARVLALHCCGGEAPEDQPPGRPAVRPNLLPAPAQARHLWPRGPAHLDSCPHEDPGPSLRDRNL